MKEPKLNQILKDTIKGQTFYSMYYYDPDWGQTDYIMFDTRKEAKEFLKRLQKRIKALAEQGIGE